MKKKLTIPVFVVQLLLVFWALIQLYPLFFMLSSSLKETGEIVAHPFALPTHFEFQNYVTAWLGNSGTATAAYNMKQFFFNSIEITAISLLLLSIVTMLAGYALARFKFPGYKFIYVFITCMTVIPVQALIVPIFLMVQSWGGLNKIVSMIPLMVAFNLPMSITIAKTNFEALPYAIEEAAYIDGCSKFKAFWNIALPMCRGTVATITIVNLTYTWSEYMYASVLLMLPKARTLPVAVSMFNTNMYNTTLGPLMAGLSIASIPLLIAYFVFQKQIVKGIAIGSIK